MTDEPKVPDPPSVVMDRFIYAVPTLVKTEESLDRLSQVIVTVFDTLFIAPLSQPLNPESAILFGKSRAALACMRTLFHAKEGLISFTSASETARHKGIPLYKTLLPRFIHAAALAAERDDTASMVEDLVETVSDVLAVLERRSEPGQPYTEGWSLAHRAVKAIKTFVQGSLQPHPAVLYGYDALTPSPIAGVICVQIIVQAQLSFLDDTIATLGSAISVLGRSVSSLPTYRDAITAIVPHSPPGVEEGVSLALRDHEDVGELLRALPDDLAITAWWEIYGQSAEVSPSKAVFLLTPGPRIPATLIRTLLDSAGLLDQWADAPQAEVREARRALLQSEQTPQKRKRADLDDVLRGTVEPDQDPLKAMYAVMKEKQQEIAKVFPQVIRKLCQAGHPPLTALASKIWEYVCPDDFTLLAIIAAHIEPRQIGSLCNKKLLNRMFTRYRHIEKRIRIPASRALAQIVATSCRHPSYETQTIVLDKVLEDIRASVKSSTPHIRTGAIHLLGAVGTAVPEELSGEVLEMLLMLFGQTDAVRALATSELCNIARHRQLPIYRLFAPHMDRIAALVATKLCERSDFIANVMEFFDISRADFVRLQAKEINTVSGLVEQHVGGLLVEYSAWILARIFRLKNPRPALDFLLECYRSASYPTTTKAVLTTCTVKMVNLLVQELGDRSEKVRKEAEEALTRAAQVHDDTSAPVRAVATFLEPHTLGVVTTLNEDLHGATRKMTVEDKRRVIRALRKLIEMLGDDLAATSPQIIASLQSSLVMPGLGEETLVTWWTFIKTLRYHNTGPFIGRTTAAVVSNWYSFSDVEKDTAVILIKEIADNASNLRDHLDEVANMYGIEELKEVAKQLADARRTRTFAEQVETLLERTSSGNAAVATTALREFRTLLLANETEIAGMSRGDSFDPLASKIMRGLMLATQDSDETVRSLAYTCLGHVGSLDNDRMAKLPDIEPVIMMHNFNDLNESIRFAFNFIRNVLVDSYKITNDIKYQGHLAFAMQDLLSFCNLRIDLLDPHSRKPSATERKMWNDLPKYQVEALAPLLHARFRIKTSGRAKELETPYYPRAGTYREWVQNWSIMLLQRILSFPPETASESAQKIFQVLKGVLRHQDVSVALFVLPHMVLHVLLSGGDEDRQAITSEINAVLNDQVNTVGSADKRALSAQVIFDLMDHLGKWLRLFRANIESERQQKHQHRHGQQYAPDPRPHSHIVIVERVLGSVETELLANAALQSKAYARSLFNFEQRIIKLQERGNAPALYAYYERLHEIYADLDEPDGMEGVSMYVMSPSLEYQIREHESTGRWTSAQSCWEVRLQQSPDDLSLHQGLLRCLRNLGHYDTLRTHIRGVLSRRPDWRTELAPFEAEAAWIVGDWQTVRSVADHGYPMAEVMSQLQSGTDSRALKAAFDKARIAAGNEITSITYSRATEPVLSLHILRELEMIYNSSAAAEAERNGTAPRVGDNREKITGNIIHHLQKSLADRFETTAPTFRVREAILSARRTAFGTVPTTAVQREIGKAWILSSKMARKAGYEQTAYSAALQAREVDAPFAFIQQAKLTKLHGGVWKAHEELSKSISPLLWQEANGTTVGPAEDRFAGHKSLAKAVLLEARWAIETNRYDRNEVVTKFNRAIHLCQELESPYYHLGHFYDGLATKEPAARAGMNYATCNNYLLALKYGNKYIYRTLPRALTIWLDLGEMKGKPAELKAMDVPKQLDKITALVDKSRQYLAPWQFLTAFPQIASRLGHKSPKIRPLLVKILALVIIAYPCQAIWPMFGLMNSSREERRRQCKEVTMRTTAIAPHLQKILNDAERFSSSLLKLADEPIPDKTKTLDLESYPYMRPVFPSEMMMPLQDLLTGTLPSNADTAPGHNGQRHLPHNPFPLQQVKIHALDKTIDVMSSLVKPKKLVFIGTDGKRYPFLCKPKDDLRKDARLMDFNAIINKLLKSASESRRRQLHIRTYAVMPLNELCGLIEWVSNTLPLKVILEDQYKRKDNKKLYTHDLHKKLEEAKAGGQAKQILMFNEAILPHFQPCAFPDWFLVTWPEPAAWLAARTAYTRTFAVMSMIGFVLGLGDRHCENILFDSRTGDTVHVDLNCLFDKGKSFDIPEKVPFRLTQNLVAAMGVTRVEGAFRKASEISMGILRNNAETLMSVLEAFVHDPLVEWASRKNNNDVRGTADKHLGNIRHKLRGEKDGDIQSVNNQVEDLIAQATSSGNLAVMYQGWAPWL